MQVAPRTLSRTDWLFPLAMSAFGALSIFIVRDVIPEEVESRLNLTGDIALTAVLILPLIWRRHHPLVTASIVAPLFAVYRLVEVPEGSMSSIAVFLAVFAAGAYGSAGRRDLIRGIAVTWSAFALIYQILGNEEFVGFDSLALVFVNLGVNVAFFAAAWLLGDASRKRREDTDELARRADQLAVEREVRAEQAVVAERLRIARELHDVVAHHVSVMGVQAAGARRVLDADPVRASEALAAVEASSRQAVTELQRLVGFLRSDEEQGSPAPQPSLDQLDELLEQVRATGLPVEVQFVGSPREVPLAVSLGAYRIVQESLTNVMKHAGNVKATVVLSYLRDALEIQIVNAGGGVSRGVSGTGRGQIGMSERASMVGGTLTAGPVASGGYRISAVLPTRVTLREDAAS